MVKILYSIPVLPRRLILSKLFSFFDKKNNNNNNSFQNNNTNKNDCDNN